MAFVTIVAGKKVAWLTSEFCFAGPHIAFVAVWDSRFV